VALLNAHGKLIKDNVVEYRVPIRSLQKALLEQQQQLGHLCDSNHHALHFLAEAFQQSGKLREGAAAPPTDLLDFAL
jgi:hypothetical protein